MKFNNIEKLLKKNGFILESHGILDGDADLSAIDDIAIFEDVWYKDTEKLIIQYDEFEILSVRYISNGIDKIIQSEKTLKDIIQGYVHFGEKKTRQTTKRAKRFVEYRTSGCEQLVRDTIVDILEDNDADDLFDLGMSNEVIMTYDNKGRSNVRNDGSVEIDYLTLPTYAWSSGYRPENKKLEKLFDDIMETNFESARERMWHEYKDELIALGITGEDDENLEYNALYDMGEGDLAERLSEYEMDMEGTDLYTDVYCQLEEIDDGIELTVTMTVDDEYGHALVNNYKSNTVMLNEDELQDADELREVIEDAIKKVTKQF